MEVGHIAAFTDAMVITDDDTAVAVVTVDSLDIPVADPQSTLTYFDFICTLLLWLHPKPECRYLHFFKLGFLLSEVDKSTPMAIRYWYESSTQ